jgi:ribonuclease HI
VGGGFAIYRGKRHLDSISFRLLDECTVFQAEVIAIREAALEFAKGSYPECKYVKFFVDSQAALMAVCNPMVQQSSVGTAIEALNKLRKKCKNVTLVWTKAHVGTEGNEEADKMAKAGAAGESYSECGIPTVERKRRVLEYYTERWNTEWVDSKGANHSKRFIKQVDRPKSGSILNFGRFNVGKIVRMVTGHNALNYFRNKIDPDIDPICRFCNEDGNYETFWHLCTECPVFREWRIEIFLDNDPSGGTWKPSELIEFSNSRKIDDAICAYDDANTDGSFIDWGR